jgi:hypothetical protein
MFRLTNVEIRRIDVDGGHICIFGIAEIPEHGSSPFYAYFTSRVEELEFERLFPGGDLEVEGDGVEYVDGRGFNMHEIRSWRLV